MNDINNLANDSMPLGTHRPHYVNKYTARVHSSLSRVIKAYSKGLEATQNRGRYAAPSHHTTSQVGTSPGNFQFNEFATLNPLLGQFKGGIDKFDRIVDLIKPVLLLGVSIDVLKLISFTLAPSTILERK